MKKKGTNYIFKKKTGRVVGSIKLLKMSVKYINGKSFGVAHGNFPHVAVWSVFEHVFVHGSGIHFTVHHVRHP